MIVQDFPPVARGAGYYVYNLSKKLIERGHKVTVLTRGSWEKTRCEEMDGIFVYRVRFIPLYPFHLHLHGFFINRLIKVMESNFDIIHLHNPLVPVIHTSLPTVITEHGTVKGGVARREVLDLFSLGLKTFSRMYISIERKLINNADRVVTVSNYVADELKSYYGIRHVAVVYSGVDTKFFSPCKTKNGNKPYILYVGALDARKGLPDLIRSAEYLLREKPDVKFILTGKGPLEKYLKRMVRNLNLDKNFYFAGYVNRSRVLKYYQNATVFVLPSYYEISSTTLSVLEALSCEVPVIVTTAVERGKAVIEGETGFFVPPKNPQKLAEVIMKILENEKMREKMGKNAREHVERNFNWEITAKKFEEIYLSFQ